MDGSSSHLVGLLRHADKGHLAVSLENSKFPPALLRRENCCRLRHQKFNLFLRELLRVYDIGITIKEGGLRPRLGPTKTTERQQETEGEDRQHRFHANVRLN